MFQKAAKRLLEDWKEGCPSALLRVNRRLEPSLMRAQHVVAKELGYSCWEELRKENPKP